MAYRVSVGDGIGVFGIILAVFIFVLDKAGKLKGGWLVGLLLLAGAMTLFVAIGNSWVLDAPAKWKLWWGVLMFSLVALTYSGMAIWISGSSADATEVQSPKPAESAVTQSPSPSPTGVLADKNKALAGEIAKEVAKMVPRQHDYQLFPQEQLHTSDNLGTLRKSRLPKSGGVKSADHSVIQQGNSGGINVQQATTGENSPIVNSPITVNPVSPEKNWVITEEICGKILAPISKAPQTHIHVSIGAFISDPDGANVVDQLLRCLPNVTWWNVSGAVLPNIPDGVVIIAAEEDRLIGESIGEGLRAAGFSVSPIQVAPILKQKNGNEIDISIGKHSLLRP